MIPPPLLCHLQSGHPHSRRGHARILPIACAHPTGTSFSRNPWGTFEWDGDWSDKSDMWSKHKMVKQSVGFMAGGTKDVDDGSFWMAWDDFVKYFDCLDVCVLSKGLNELRLDPREDVGVCGPFFGCVLGCAWFWCACQGLAKMLCKRDGADKDEAAEIENLVAEGGGPAAAVGDLDIDMPTSPVV